MLDAANAARLDMTFRKLPNGVITTDGINNEIPPDCFADSYKPDGAKLKITSLMADRPSLVSGTQDNLPPTPCNILNARDTVFLPIESGDSHSETVRRSPSLPPRPRSPAFQPRSPNAEQLGERSPERRPPWYPQGTGPVVNNSCTRRGRSRTPCRRPNNNPILPTEAFSSSEYGTSDRC